MKPYHVAALRGTCRMQALQVITVACMDWGVEVHAKPYAMGNIIVVTILCESDGDYTTYMDRLAKMDWYSKE